MVGEAFEDGALRTEPFGLHGVVEVFEGDGVDFAEVDQVDRVGGEAVVVEELLGVLEVLWRGC